MPDDLTAPHPWPDLTFHSPLLDQIHAHLLQYRLHVQGVLPTTDDPEESHWVYTIGLNALDGLPDLIVTGLPPRLAQNFLNSLARQLRHGTVVLPRDLDVDLHTVLQGYPVRLRAVHPSQLDDHVGLAQAYQTGLDARPEHVPEKTALQFVQLPLPDKSGHFPGEDGVSRSWDQMTLPLHLPSTDASGPVQA